jgi:hypothetical protein
VKIILHVGMSKSGSTALQHGLVHLRDRLRAEGYLYPDGRNTRHNHSFLVCAALPPEKLPRHYRARYRKRPGDVRKDLADWLADIRSAIEKHRPKVLLLSGETLFKLVEPAQFEAIAATLHGLAPEPAPEIEVVAYVRKPSDYYMSSAQQTLKASHRIKPAGPVSYRSALEGFAGIANRIHVVKYDRALFPGGDVVRHFLETFCERAVPVGDIPSISANVSHSAEALAVLAEYRRLYHPKEAGVFTRDTALLRQALVKADKKVPGDLRPRLKSSLARTIDEGSVDLLWLRETYGIVFNGIDYDRIAPMSNHPRPKRLGAVCAVNEERRAHLELHVIRELTRQLVPPKKKPETSAQRLRTPRSLSRLATLWNSRKSRSPA